MKAPTFPKSVKVGWSEYRIEKYDPREAAGESRYGETSHTAARIRVDFSFGTRQAAATLFHEILHAIHALWAVSDDDKEERTVKLLEHGICTVWRDNPDVMAWIGYYLVHGS